MDKVTIENRLASRDFEMIGHLLYKSSDEIAVAIGRSFERLEERMDCIESRNYKRLAEIEEKFESSHQDIADTLGEIADDHKSLREAVTA